MKRNLLAILVGAFTIMMGSPLASQNNLDNIKAKGFVECGVSHNSPGFSIQDGAGDWTGLDVDFCRALAAAVLGDSGRVKFTPLSVEEGFTNLKSGYIDVLSRNVTWTAKRDTALGVKFVGVNFYDGQGFMVRRSLGVSSAAGLNGSSICITSGTASEENVGDYFRSNGLNYRFVRGATAAAAEQAYDSGRCDVLSGDISALFAHRSKLNNSGAHLVLPEVISKKPRGPVVRQGDDQWFNVARWTLNAMINAEELGVAQTNVDQMRGSNNVSIKTLLGTQGNIGGAQGLSSDWAYNIIAAVGNYSESFEASFGRGSTLDMPRGLNALWDQGGVMYAPPIH